MTFSSICLQVNTSFYLSTQQSALKSYTCMIGGHRQGAARF